MSVILVFVRVLLGALFIFSGFSKLFPIELFEYDLIETGLVGWTLAPYFSRLLIAFEIFLGLLFWFNYRPKKITYPAAFTLLLVFTIFLAYRWVGGHASENCGCFGTWLPMSVKASIIKNMITLMLIGFLYVRNQSSWSFKKVNLLAVITFLCIVSGVFAFRVPDDFYLKEDPPPLENNLINPQVLPPVVLNNDTIRPQKEKSFWVFLSLTCGHCLKAARKLSIIKNQHPELKMIAYLNGERKDLPAFIKETKFSLPYALFNKREFVFITQGSVPKIYFVKDFQIKNYWAGEDFTEKELVEAWQGL